MYALFATTSCAAGLVPLPLLSAGTAEGLLQADPAVEVQVRAHGDEEDLRGRAALGVFRRAFAFLGPSL